MVVRLLSVRAGLPAGRRQCRGSSQPRAIYQWSSRTTIWSDRAAVNKHKESLRRTRQRKLGEDCLCCTLPAASQGVGELPAATESLKYLRTQAICQRYPWKARCGGDYLCTYGDGGLRATEDAAERAADRGEVATAA